MNSTVDRLSKMEGRFERLILREQQVEQQVAAINSQIQLLQQGQPSGVVYSGVVYVAVTGSGGIPAASAAPGSGTPGSATGLSVYAISGGAYSLVTSSATVYNPYLSATASAVKVVTVAPNGDGTFTLLAESCT